MNGYIDPRGREKESVSGTVDSVIYQSDDTGYTVCEIENDADGLPVVLVGTMPYIAEGDSLTATGSWTSHPTYGRQFKVDMYEKILPASREGILRYLASGAVRGIGPRSAEKIVDKFGEDTFDVIENHADWLAEIPGISRRKADDICSAFIEMSGARNVMMFCADYFGSATSMKIYKKWGGRAVDMIRTDPYRLCDEFSGIGFRRADSIAKGCGLEADSTSRIGGALKYVLSEAAHSGGHTCLPEAELLSMTARLISVLAERVSPVLETLCDSGKLCRVRDGEAVMIYLARYRQAEVYSADKLREILRRCPKIEQGDVGAFIRDVELRSGITYAEKQKEAVFAALSSGIMILTGGPGTGKTTVIKGLISIFDSIGLDVALCAPTGRAAKRMSETTGSEAKTIHRLLEMERSDEDDPKFMRNGTNFLDENVIIVDEASMIDILLLEALAKAVKPGSRIIFIGDKDQLPSVGCGNVLEDLIGCGLFMTVCLTEIFRQAEESRIIVNAHAINEGIMPDISNKASDFFFLSRESDTDVARTVADLLKNRLPKAYGADFAAGAQVITPSRKGAAGTEELNALLQSALNPPAADKNERSAHGIVFRDGDRVMQNKNNYDAVWEKDGYEGEGIFNGDIGVIEDIDAGAQCMTVNFDERVTEYDFTLLDELEHAYAITVHKSQGSEYPAVIIPLYSCAPMLLTRNLLYTAVTRAEKMVILVGRRDVLATMVENNMHRVRHTGLSRLLAPGV